MSKKRQTWYRKTWDFLWHEDSVWSWLANVLIAFVLIKFVIYPLAGLVMGTSLPVVAVVSSSMDHDPAEGRMCGQLVPDDAGWWETCGDWYEQRNITAEAFEDYPFSNGFNKGDVMVLWRSDPQNTDIGDVIVFQSAKQYPIIHRIVDKQTVDGVTAYTTKGDHNEDSIEEYALSDGRHLYLCYQELDQGIAPSLCGPGVLRVTQDTPGAIMVLDEVGVPEDLVIGKAVARIPFAGWLKIWFVELLSLVGLQGAIPVLSA